MAFSYNEVENTVEYIHAAPDGFGGSAADPVRLQHFYDWAIAPEQGLLPQKAGDNSFYFPFGINLLTSSSTYFKMDNEALECVQENWVTGDPNICIYILCNAELINPVLKGNRYAQILGVGTKVIKAPRFHGFSTLWLGNVILTNALASNISNPYPLTHASSSIDGWTTEGGWMGVVPHVSGVKADNIRAFGCSNGIRIGQGSYTLKYFDAINCTYDIYLFYSGVDRQCILINSKVRLNSFSLFGGTGVWRETDWGTLWLKSDFQVLCAEEGAEVKLYDNTDDLVLDTVIAGGETVETPITYYKRINTFTTDVISHYEPFKVVISKAGYQDYVLEDLYMTEEVSPGVRRGRLQATVVRATMVEEIPLLSAAEIVAAMQVVAEDFKADVSAIPTNPLLTNDARLDNSFSRLEELHRLQGLESGSPMTVTPTSRTATGINLEITGDGVNETIVTRV